MPVRQVSPWWWYWVFQNVTVQTTRVFAGSWAAARVVPNRRDSRGCQLEIVDVGMLSREVLQKILGNAWLFMWSDDWMIGWLDLPNEWMSENDVGLWPWPSKTLGFFTQQALLTDRERVRAWCDRLCQHKGTTIRRHLPGRGARPKSCEHPFFSSPLKMPRVSLWSSDMLSFVLTLVSRCFQ